MTEPYEQFDALIAGGVAQAKATGEQQRAAMQAARDLADERMSNALARFKRAARASNGALQAQEVDGRIELTWTACAPTRRLALERLATVGGHVCWELHSDFHAIDVFQPEQDQTSGVLRAADVTLAIIDRLILALLDQDAWGAGRLPLTTVEGSIGH